MGAHVGLEIREIPRRDVLIYFGHAQGGAAPLHAAQAVGELVRRHAQRVPHRWPIKGRALDGRPAQLAQPEAVDDAAVAPVGIDDALADIAQGQLHAVDLGHLRVVQALAVPATDNGRFVDTVARRYLAHDQHVVQVEPVGELLVARQRRDVDVVADPDQVLGVVVQHRLEVVIQVFEHDLVALVSEGRGVAVGHARAEKGLRLACPHAQARPAIEHQLLERLVPDLVIDARSLGRPRGELGQRRRSGYAHRCGDRDGLRLLRRGVSDSRQAQRKRSGEDGQMADHCHGLPTRDGAFPLGVCHDIAESPTQKPQLRAGALRAVPTGGPASSARCRSGRARP